MLPEPVPDTQTVPRWGFTHSHDRRDESTRRFLELHTPNSGTRNPRGMNWQRIWRVVRHADLKRPRCGANIISVEGRHEYSIERVRFPRGGVFKTKCWVSARAISAVVPNSIRIPLIGHKYTSR